MTPVELRITNFRSFRKTQRFVFPDGPGLYFMQGVNEAEPRLDANGAGKSTIWEALNWVGFGKTSRGLKAGDVGNWEVAKGTVVEFDFVSPSGEDCTLVRTWKPNSWRLESTGNRSDVTDLDKAERNYFYGWLGIDGMSPWLHSVMMAQGQPMFLDLKAEAKAQLFAEVMDLEKWSAYSSRASKAAVEVDRGLRQAEQALAQCKGEIDATMRVDYKKDRDSWERERAEKIDRLHMEYEQCLNFSTVKEDLEAAEKVEAEKRIVLKALVTKVDIAEHNLRDALDLLREHEARMAKAEGLWEAAKKILEEANQGKCPTCGQETKGNHAHLGEVREQLEATEKKLKEGREALKRLREDEAVDREAVDKATAAHKAARDAVYDAEDAVKGLRRDKLIEDKRLDAIEEEVDDLKAAVNPFDRMEADTQRRLKALRQERTDLEDKLERGQWRWSILNYWTRGFKEVRLQEISGALTELEIEVNSAVAALGLDNWNLEFQVDRETKSGSLARGFNVFVQSPHNDRAVPWEAWSGGEGQRLRLAANMGLADLVRARTGMSLDLEVWDEPTQGLSPQGVQDLLEALARRAKQEQRQIWIVDHRSHSFGGFAGGVNIVKTPSGSLVRSV